MIQLDIEYARNKSFWLDVKVLFKTFPALLVQIGDLRLRKKILHRTVAETTLPVRVINH
jgi:lipopolysaccharide/colanic/teichoic acid biosynthesis glycosyltransferase